MTRSVAYNTKHNTHDECGSCASRKPIFAPNRCKIGRELNGLSQHNVMMKLPPGTRNRRFALVRLSRTNSKYTCEGTFTADTYVTYVLTHLAQV